ncbi:uroporphyrinogen-III synthase [Anianabacter salinae]|uniref:uroporphyrinogen-III synthase n=1 Tax=Anianabacter salinae TaxID=2851023 RepID=UPI00225E5D33|nr:uroporphyrinogen-III synthase [Anianabacter salinae]MBV0913448.1 uroporphyrinogen-III synthase [Anianabacter salinae]
MTDLPSVIVTRPEPGASDFAAALQSRIAGAQIVVSPVLEIVFHQHRGDLSGWALLLFTSANAVRAVGPPRPGTRALCVGAATTEAARAAGFDAAMGGEDAAGLLAAILQDPPSGPVLHLRGAHARGDIVGALSRAGIAAEDRVVYDQQERPLSAEAIGTLSGPARCVLPVFSPRTALLLSRQMPVPVAPIDLIAISDAVRGAWQGPAPRRLIVADRPDMAAMLDATAAACADALP